MYADMPMEYLLRVIYDDTYPLTSLSRSSQAITLGPPTRPNMDTSDVRHQQPATGPRFSHASAMDTPFSYATAGPMGVPSAPRGNQPPGEGAARQPSVAFLAGVRQESERYNPPHASPDHSPKRQQHVYQQQQCQQQCW